MSCEIPECTGECCRRFPIAGMSSAELTAAVNNNEPLSAWSRELFNIAANVYPVPYVDGDPSQHMFSCRRWNPDTKRCVAYDRRPPYMCGEFPYDGGACRYCGAGVAVVDTPKTEAAECL